MVEPNQLNYTIPSTWAGRTLDSYLRHGLQFSRSQVRALKKNSGMLLNSHQVWASHRLEGGEELTLIIQPIEQSITPENIPLSILYEDPDIIVINKQAGMTVHPVGVYKSHTLANALVFHWQAKKEAASFHPVHRLDRLTSGLILIAKHSWAHQQLSRQLQSGSFHRLYLAIGRGNPLNKSGKITAPLKHADTGFRWIIDPEGKLAITRYRILRQTNNACLAAIRLYTGRTHQIRAHFAHLGTPLWGDPIYGFSDPAFPRPALHAARLSFIHPRFNKFMKFTIQPPTDFQALLANNI